MTLDNEAEIKLTATDEQSAVFQRNSQMLNEYKRQLTLAQSEVAQFGTVNEQTADSLNRLEKEMKSANVQYKDAIEQARQGATETQAAAAATDTFTTSTAAASAAMSVLNFAFFSFVSLAVASFIGMVVHAIQSLYQSTEEAEKSITKYTKSIEGLMNRLDPLRAKTEDHMRLQYDVTRTQLEYEKSLAQSQIREMELAAIQAERVGVLQTLWFWTKELFWSDDNLNQIMKKWGELQDVQASKAANLRAQLQLLKDGLDATVPSFNEFLKNHNELKPEGKAQEDLGKFYRDQAKAAYDAQSAILKKLDAAQTAGMIESVVIEQNTIKYEENILKQLDADHSAALVREALHDQEMDQLDKRFKKMLEDNLFIKKTTEEMKQLIDAPGGSVLSTKDESDLKHMALLEDQSNRLRMSYEQLAFSLRVLSGEFGENAKAMELKNRVMEFGVSLDKALISGVQSYILGQERLGPALKHAVAGSLAATAARAAVEGLYMTGIGFAAMTPWGAALYGPASNWFSGAAQMFSVAAVAGVGARALSAGSGSFGGSGSGGGFRGEESLNSRQVLPMGNQPPAVHRTVIIQGNIIGEEQHVQEVIIPMIESASVNERSSIALKSR